MLKKKHVAKHRNSNRKIQEKTLDKALTSEKAVIIESKLKTTSKVNNKTVKTKNNFKNNEANKVKTVSKVSVKTKSKNPNPGKSKSIVSSLNPKAVESKINSLTSKIKTKKVHISIGFLVLLVGLTAFLSIKQNAISAISNYENAVYEINVNTEDQVKNASNAYYSLAGSLVVDETVSGSFKEAADGTRRAMLAMETLTPPEKFKKQHELIIKNYMEINSAYGGLAGISAYSSKRNKYLEDIGSHSRTIVAKINSTSRRVEAVEIGSGASNHLRADYKNLKLIASKSKDIILLRYLSSLNANLTDLEESIVIRSRTKIKGSLEIISQEYSQNWAKIFVKDEEKKLLSAGKKLNKSDDLLKNISTFNNKEI